MKPKYDPERVAQLKREIAQRQDELDRRGRGVSPPRKVEEIKLPDPGSDGKLYPRNGGFF